MEKTKENKLNKISKKCIILEVIDAIILLFIGFFITESLEWFNELIVGIFLTVVHVIILRFLFLQYKKEKRTEKIRVRNIFTNIFTTVIFLFLIILSLYYDFSDIYSSLYAILYLIILSMILEIFTYVYLKEKSRLFNICEICSYIIVVCLMIMTQLDLLFFIDVISFLTILFCIKKIILNHFMKKKEYVYAIMLSLILFLNIFLPTKINKLYSNIIYTHDFESSAFSNFITETYNITTNKMTPYIYKLSDKQLNEVRYIYYVEEECKNYNPADMNKFNSVRKKSNEFTNYNTITTHLMLHFIDSWYCEDIIVPNEYENIDVSVNSSKFNNFIVSNSNDVRVYDSEIKNFTASNSTVYLGSEMLGRIDNINIDRPFEIWKHLMVRKINMQGKIIDFGNLVFLRGETEEFEFNLEGNQYKINYYEAPKKVSDIKVENATVKVFNSLNNEKNTNEKVSINDVIKIYETESNKELVSFIVTDL